VAAIVRDATIVRPIAIAAQPLEGRMPGNTSECTELVIRLEGLEKQNRRIKQTGAILAVCRRIPALDVPSFAAPDDRSKRVCLEG
jgi:hypothetical protein